jgi:hypothetical protein
MPDTITWGHILIVLAAVAAIWAVLNFLRWFRQREAGQGTPQYADGRLARRSALYGALIAAALAAIGCLTPLCDTPLA